MSLNPSIARYLKSSPKGNRASIIYEKLFQLYLKSNKLQKADNILNSYQVQIPQKRVKHEAFTDITVGWLS